MPEDNEDEQDEWMLEDGEFREAFQVGDRDGAGFVPAASFRLRSSGMA